MAKKSEKFGIVCVFCCVITAITAFSSSLAIAAEPPSAGKYYVQVPHVVLPETIQYKPYTESRGYNVTAGASQRPATYTAFPSFSIPDGTEFRIINQLYYPVSSVAPSYLVSQASGTIAQVSADNQIVPLQRDSANLTNVPKFELPPSVGIAQQETEPVYLTKINETKNPILQVNNNVLSDNVLSESADDCESPTNSIVFLKSQRTVPMDKEISDSFAPLRLSQATPRDLSWLDRESAFVRPVTFTDVSPMQLGYIQPGTGLQQAQVAPAYDRLGQLNYSYGQQPYQPNPYGGATTPHPNYTAATGLNSAWNAYFGAASSQQLPAMTSPPMPMPGYGMQQPMQAATQQQTIGYILLYPQAAQSGVNMQLVGQRGQENDGTNASDEAATGDMTATALNIPNGNAMQLQATFIPAAQMPNFPGQYQQMPQMPMPNPMMMGGMNPSMMHPMMMGGMNPSMMNPMMMGGMNPSMMHPMMMGGMNPSMMHPMMMGGMNPYMMNPMMMMGMGSMMPPIIIQMPADSGRRRGGGLFARMRAARQELPNSYQQASNSMSALFGQPAQMPAKAAYPYGYFGVTASPSQAGNFGGYHDMSTQTVRYPGM
ncbi:MAG: hypothetical protein FWD31_08850 [Planctomycetaceae bacterium]|nr:hypothetical protein [Planctomycetaceae bacterium]